MSLSIGRRLVAVMVLHALVLSACDNSRTTAPTTPPPPTYSIGGSLSGLASGSSVLLQNNGRNTTTVSANGSFRFSTQVISYTSYTVTLLNQPSGQTCTVSAGSGTVYAADITSVLVGCTTSTFTVSGTVSGLAGGTQLTLQNNGANPTTVKANGSFSFLTPVPNNGGYSVSVLTQPTGQTCTVNAGSGAVNLSNVTDVQVQCATSIYTVSAMVSGLQSGTQVTLQNNGGDSITVKANGSFSFPTSILYNGSYAVTVAVQPAAQTCVVSGGSGAHITANVSASVACAQATAMVLHSFGSGVDGAYPQTTLIQGSDGNFYGTTAAGGAAGVGTMFKITPLGVETVLYSFLGGASDGNSPLGALILGSDGNFYGTTGYDGANSRGTAFKITPLGVETLLHSFGGSGDGVVPNTALILGSDGFFYGTTTFGGSANAGTVFKMTPSGVESVVYSFLGGSSDGNLPQGLVLGSDGNFYGTTLIGGNGNNGLVFKLTPSGAESVLHLFTGGTADGANPQAPLIQGSDGNFYGTTSSGGTAGNGTVFKITPLGVETVVYSFLGGVADGAVPQATLIQGSDGNFYGTTFGGGTADSGTLFKITPLGVETMLYSFQGSPDGASPQAILIQGTDGNFYGTTTNGGAASAGTVFSF